ncbi:MAG: SiaB family protein kinase [Bacteroidota bacterium]
MTSTEMPSIKNYLDDIHENEKIIAHVGTISDEVVDSILKKAEKHLENQDDLKAQKKVFGILVEVLQNILKHSITHKNSKDDQSCLFLFKRNSNYGVIAGNYISSQSIGLIQKGIEHANSLNSEEIRNYYRDKLDTGKLSKKGGAGLGLIDIVRKSGSQLNYWFEEVNAHISLFCLEVHINM